MKKTTKKLLKEFLEMLESNISGGVSEQRLKEEFGSAFDTLVQICTEGKDEEHLIRGRAGLEWNITNKGMFYLDKLRNLEIQRNQLLINNEVSIANVLLGFIILIQTGYLIFNGLFVAEIIGKDVFLGFSIIAGVVLISLIIFTTVYTTLKERQLKRI